LAGSALDAQALWGECPKESAARAGNLETEGDCGGAAIWRRITDAVEQLANTTPTGLMH
jgi:hypothetical protein